jgi:hypothetical protein
MDKLLVNSGTLFVDNDCADETQLRDIAREVFSNIAHLEQSYPDFGGWYSRKVVNGLVNGSRSFIIELRDGKMAGVAILKDTLNEKKICTISVADEFKAKGLGYRLFEKSMRVLDTDKPLASVSESRLAEFEKIFQYLGYEYSAEYRGLYLPQKSEFSFNGVLQ